MDLILLLKFHVLMSNLRSIKVQFQLTGTKGHVIQHLSHCHDTLPSLQKYSVKASLAALALLLQLWPVDGMGRDDICIAELRQDPGISSPVSASSSSVRPFGQ